MMRLGVCFVTGETSGYCQHVREVEVGFRSWTKSRDVAVLTSRYGERSRTRGVQLPNRPVVSLRKEVTNADV